MHDEVNNNNNWQLDDALQLTKDFQISCTSVNLQHN